MSRKSSYKLLIKGLVLPASIGIYEHEKNKEQKIKIDVTMEMRSKPSSDEIDSVVSYDDIIANIHKLLNSGHFNLVETLVEKIGNLCLEENNVKKVTVSVQKLNAVTEAEGVGAEIIIDSNIDPNS